MDVLDIMIGIWAVFAIVGVIALGLIIYDGVYVKPIADNNANNYCQNLGFDQYKSFSRVGVFSIKPVGIKCEYAERYTDLGVRSTPS